MFVRKLKNPVVWNAGASDEKRYSEIACDFDRLVGSDLTAASAEADILRGNRPAVVSEFDPLYLQAVVARASGLPMDLIGQAPARDFTALVMEAKRFLLEEDSEDEEVAAAGA